MRFQCVLSTLLIVFCVEIAGDDDAPPPPKAANRIKVCWNHPNIDDLLKTEGGTPYNLPTTHPTIHPLFAPYLPNGIYRLFYSLLLKYVFIRTPQY